MTFSEKPKIHLVCNAHLDPVWLWEWEEGAAEAMSTFRSAADLCEEFDGFIFNHNEAVLYRWVEEYEPSLFKRIQKLVRQGKWHIMGGWYLQPDCNMPSGESFVRQILLGRRYFQEKFGVTPTVAVNLDPFGHTRGLVQILQKSGYNAYLFCRPDQEQCPLPSDTFIWEGYDGSRIAAARASSFYNSPLGKANEKVKNCLKNLSGDTCVILLWGVGNHGGGPSRIDLKRLTKLIHDTPNVDIRHSTPESYFKELKQRSEGLPIHQKDLNPWAVGCYTSQVRIKQKHRRLENELYATEKMASAAWCAGRMLYPAGEFRDAMYDLATGEFHDILPGSSIQPAEETALRLMDHALEILSRAKTRAFFALAQGQPKAKNGRIPVLVYNPHPYPVKTIVECEFQLADQDPNENFTHVQVCRNGKSVPAQVEKELSNIPIEWRKRVVFTAELAPAQMNRFDCTPKVIPAKPKPQLKSRKGKILFKTNELEVMINARTGLIDRYRVNGVDHVNPGACRPIVILDNEDPWGMLDTRFRKIAGRFRLLSKKDGMQFSGVRDKLLPSVRIIEDGPVRSVVEALFGYGDSFICQRYKLPKHGTEIEVETRVFWNEKDRMLKLSIPTPDKKSSYYGQVAFGADIIPADGTEVVAHKWVSVISKDHDTTLTCINEGIYGSDFAHGEMRLSLLRSPAYSAHPLQDRTILPQDRFSPRIDQGERIFRFWLNAGPIKERLATVDREALAKNEKPMALSFFPSGDGSLAKPFVKLNDKVIQVTAIKKAERGEALILRLFEPTGRKRSATISLPFVNMKKRVTLDGFEIRTIKIDLRKRLWTEVDLMERTDSP